jgi:hypothetical protein
VCDWERVLQSTQIVDGLVRNPQIVASVTVCHKTLDIVIYTILCVNHGLQCEICDISEVCFLIVLSVSEIM